MTFIPTLGESLRDKRCQNPHMFILAKFTNAGLRWMSISELPQEKLVLVNLSLRQPPVFYQHFQPLTKNKMSLFTLLLTFLTHSVSKASKFPLLNKKKIIIAPLVIVAGLWGPEKRWPPAQLRAPPCWTARGGACFFRVPCPSLRPRPFPRRVPVTTGGEKQGPVQGMSGDSPRMGAGRGSHPT